VAVRHPEDGNRLARGDGTGAERVVVGRRLSAAEALALGGPVSYSMSAAPETRPKVHCFGDERRILPPPSD
jgi:hypothetical protein